MVLMPIELLTQRPFLYVKKNRLLVVFFGLRAA
jgi:hypothetical protein